MNRKPQQLSLFQEKTVEVRWVAEYLNTSPQTVLRLLQDGRIHGFRLTPKGWWRIIQASVFEYEKSLGREYL
jgi:excisionase family DNA binding protein